MNKVLDFEATIATDSPDIVAVTETFGLFYFGL